MAVLFGIKATDRVKSFLFRFIAVPAKWIRTARQYKLNIYENKPYKLICGTRIKQHPSLMLWSKPLDLTGVGKLAYVRSVYTHLMAKKQTDMSQRAAKLDH